MSGLTLDLSDLGLEFEVIAYSLQTGALPEGLKAKHFAGSKARWIADKMDTLGVECSPAILVSELRREGRGEETEEFERMFERLLAQRVNSEALPGAVERLQELEMGRGLADVLSGSRGVAESLKNRRIYEAIQMLENFLYSEQSTRGVVAEGSFIEDEEEILAAVDEMMEDEGFKGCPTFIPPLDDIIFGVAPGECALLVGGSGDGKSIGLLDIGMRNWDWANKNVLGVTIEMKKKQQQFRQLSWALDINSDKFRSGDFTREEREAMGQYFREKRGRENEFYWVDIPEHVTAADIERKILKTERERRKEYDLILIDYLGIMSPVGRHKSRLDWDAQGEIAWNVHNLARRLGKGIWSAVQKKENISDRERSKGTLKSVGLSYLIAQPVDIVGVFTEMTLEGYLDVNFAKVRGAAKARAQLIPELRFSRIHKIEEGQRTNVA